MGHFRACCDGFVVIVSASDGEAVTVLDIQLTLTKEAHSDGQFELHRLRRL